MKKSIKLFSCIYFIGIGLFAVYTCISHRIVLGSTDGINQHYRAMMYISDLYKNILSSFIHGQVDIPMYDLNIGMGDDILATLNYYGLGDPFYLLTVFASHRIMPYFYTMFFYFRLYLAGIVMIFYGYRALPGRKSESYVVAAFVYCFSGFALEANCHIIFIHAMMYLPLILWAIIGCYEGKKYSHIILTISVMFLACTNVYFLYIISIASCIYALSLLTVYKEKRIAIVRIVFSYLMGILCSAVILFPVGISILNSNRQQAAGAESYIRLLYSYTEYKRLFYRIFYVTDDARGMAAVPIIGLICVIVILTAKRNKRLITWIVIGTVCYCLPIIAWIMSGMGGNVYGRWEIVLTVMIAVCVIEAWDEIVCPKKASLIIIWTIFLVMVLIGILDHTLAERCYRNSLAGYFMCCVAILIIYVFRNKSEKFLRLSITVIALACAFMSWITNVINYDINSLHEHDDKINDIRAYDSDSFYRIDNTKAYNFTDNVFNLSINSDYSTSTEYFSIDNPGYVNGRYRLGMGDSYLITGFDNRSILQSLSSVKYVVSERDDKYNPSYGFKKYESLSDEDVIVYNNEYVLPMAYIYTSQISEEEFEQLDAVEKQVAMIEFMAYGNASSQKQHIDESIAINPDIIDISSDITENGIQYTLKCLCKENKETYLTIDDQTFSGMVIIDGYVKKLWGEGINSINLGFYKDNTIVNVEFLCKKELEPNQLHLKELDVVSLFQENIAELKKNSIDDIRIGKNTVKCTSDITENAFLCMSIPYTKGWTAYIDGDNVETFVANDIFLGISIPDGKHEIEFKYETPGLRIGLIVSLCTGILLISICILERKRYDQKGDSVC